MRVRKTRFMLMCLLLFMLTLGVLSSIPANAAAIYNETGATVDAELCWGIWPFRNCMTWEMKGHSHESSSGNGGTLTILGIASNSANKSCQIEDYGYAKIVIESGKYHLKVYREDHSLDSCSGEIRSTTSRGNFPVLL